MKNKTKIFAVLCMIAVLALTMCVSAFADDVPIGANLILSASVSELGASDVPPNVIGATKIQIVANGDTIYEVENPYKYEFIEQASTLVFNVYNTVDDYNDLITSYVVQFDGYTSSIVTSGVTYDNPAMEFYIIFTGATSYTVGNFPGISFEVEEGSDPAVTSITGVFFAMTSFIIGGINLVQPVFYANGGLTLLGSLAVIALAVGVAFLIIGVIQKFLALRG